LREKKEVKGEGKLGKEGSMRVASIRDETGDLSPNTRLLSKEKTRRKKENKVHKKATN